MILSLPRIPVPLAKSVLSYPCPEPRPLFPHLRSQITHQSHFISLAQTAHQSDGRMRRNMIVDWLVGGEGVEQLSHPLTTAACCEMSEWAWGTDRIHSPSLVFSSSSSSLLATRAHILLSFSDSPIHTCSVSKIVLFPLTLSAVSLHMTADSVARSDTEQSSAGASAVTHTYTITHTCLMLWKPGEVRLVPGGRKQITHCATHAHTLTHKWICARTHVCTRTNTSGSARVERGLFADLLLYCHSEAGHTRTHHKLCNKAVCMMWMFRIKRRL